MKNNNWKVFKRVLKNILKQVLLSFKNYWNQINKNSRNYKIFLLRNFLE